MSERKLRCYLNWLALKGMNVPGREPFGAMREAGYDGVQFVEPLEPALMEKARATGLGVCGSGRVNTPEDALRLAKEAREHRLECLTLHVGWGMEDDAEAHALIRAVLDARDRTGVPLYVETHRATVFQDMWRTVQFVRGFPEVEFNGDFSHWYTGQEMVYGGFEKKLTFIRPVIERVRFMHGRIGNPGCMQVDVGDGRGGEVYVGHFRAMWTEAFRAFKGAVEARDEFIFCPELLAADIFYAREFDGRGEGDRWAQSLVLKRVAEECWVAAAG